MKEDKLGTLEEAIEFDKKRNYQYTAPVAWMDKNGVPSSVQSELYNIPLYTAPRELSDEEIMEVADNLKESSEPYNINFARAILKKASEK